ncbi:carboxylesterase [Mycolicibacterium agri]|uniref:Carboxylic ester hydrolase n=1 Tax=Mycolicibacterium agri TaxID=36811 RepID=A0A2A7N2H2_MYCAG|nr:carboxylesterase/lipase family protein [Mycolicibacterium agri]PEG38094.1 carboxylesterase [Mycolicibacterium agri]GFG48839.1 carboxylic ester hydrolase [Mycolicibacterium agri]
MKRENTLVETVYGAVRGADDGRVIAWKGVRFAAPPVGDLRWRAPEPPQRWSSVADATRYGFACPQPVDPRVPMDLGAPRGEDCLTLNVWAPSGTAAGDGKPVLVWVHGGAYVIGAGSQPLFDGRVLAGEGDVVVVTVNYRLGALGFMDMSEFDGPGHRFDSNIGLRDVLAALQWVRDNIAAFGGDPDRVTVFGESAGAAIITTLLTSPAAEGLFAAAIAQSAPATSIYARGRSSGVARQVLNRLGLRGSDVDRLRDVPVDAIVAAATQVFYETPMNKPGTLAFAPTVDGDLVPDYPVKLAREGRSHRVPLLIGTNKHEAALFKWMKSPLVPITPEAINAMFNEIASEQPHLQLPTDDQLGSAYAGLRGKARGMSVARDLGFRMPSVWLAEGHSEVAPVYLYRFDFATPMLRLLRIAAAHATELPFVWGNLGTTAKDPTFKLGGRRTGRAVSERMRARWVNFARRGEPLGLPGEPHWPSYKDPDRMCLLIDERDSVVSDIDAHIRPVWGNEVLNFR